MEDGTHLMQQTSNSPEHAMPISAAELDAPCATLEQQQSCCTLHIMLIYSVVGPSSSKQHIDLGLGDPPVALRLHTTCSQTAANRWLGLIIKS
eukprot:655387-Amphidinium_carterae.1